MLIIGEKLSIIAKRVREAMEKRDKGPIQEIAKRQYDEGSRTRFAIILSFSPMISISLNSFLIS